ncbi:MAG TPA: M48 family metalloprotease [Solirubrobacteraceae bacterium]|nr:M48 family metalloprotease [Solirubrobacteraceae bacterium]
MSSPSARDGGEAEETSRQPRAEETGSQPRAEETGSQPRAEEVRRRWRAGGLRSIAGVVAGLALIGLWVWAAHLLWHSSEPAGSHLAQLDPSHYFSRAFLARSASYQRFLDIDGLLSTIALVVVLVIYAARGARLMRESAAGPIGTGMLLGMLGFAIVWLAQVPFGLAAVWWERRHHVSHQGYVSSLVESFSALGSKFLFVSFALALAMGLARLTRSWWVLAVPLFAALALLFSFLSIYLIPDTHPLRTATTLTDARQLARVEGIPNTRVEVQNVARFTTAPNAESVGFGPTRRVILWDTLLDGRFDRSQVRAVLGHELGHLAHHHIAKGVGWLALFLIPATALIAYFTRGRGGLGRPEAVPLALLVFIVLQLIALPLQNIVSRHIEAEADWASLRATHDPAGTRSLFRTLASSSLEDPEPPTWSYVLNANHPTIMQRIEMVNAWQQRNPAR